MLLESALVSGCFMTGAAFSTWGMRGVECIGALGVMTFGGLKDPGKKDGNLSEGGSIS